MPKLLGLWVLCQFLPACSLHAQCPTRTAGVCWGCECVKLLQYQGFAFLQQFSFKSLDFTCTGCRIALLQLPCLPESYRGQVIGLCYPSAGFMQTKCSRGKTLLCINKSPPLQNIQGTQKVPFRPVRLLLAECLLTALSFWGFWDTSSADYGRLILADPFRFQCCSDVSLNPSSLPVINVPLSITD